MPRWLPVLITLCWAAPALAQPPVPDSVSDPVTDTVTDAGSDADAGTGAGADTGADTDTGTGAGADAGADTGAGTGAGADAGADTGADADAGTGAGADTGADTDTGTGTDADADTGTGADAGAGAGAARDRPPPKIATVVAGDPDETLRNTAAFIESEVVLAGLRAPTDPALRTAMLGEAPKGEDGLEGLRALRRGLGLDPRKDLQAYKRIGLIAGADALLVVRREGAIVVEVFDVSAAQFYEGVLEFDGSAAEQRLKFIVSRAEQAQLRWTAPPDPPPEPSPKVGEGEQPADESRAKRRWKKAWPYVVAGVLLGAGVTYLIIDRRRPTGGGPPLLRFRPGEQ